MFCVIGFGNWLFVGADLGFSGLWLFRFVDVVLVSLRFGDFDLGGWFRLFWLFWGGLWCRFCLGVVTWVCVLGVLLVWWVCG